MSLHKSLRTAGKLGRHRNVLTRAERIEKLAEDGRFIEGETGVYGLPKVRTIVKAVGKKKKKKKEEESED